MSINRSTIKDACSYKLVLHLQAVIYESFLHDELWNIELFTLSFYRIIMIDLPLSGCFLTTFWLSCIMLQMGKAIYYITLLDLFDRLKKRISTAVQKRAWSWGKREVVAYSESKSWWKSICSLWYRNSIEVSLGLHTGLIDTTKKVQEGLKDKPKCGRTSHLPSEIALKVRKKLTERKQGWSTKQVNDDMIVPRVWNPIPLYSCIQTAPQMGF